MWVLGLTGGIGSGKSAVAALFSVYGIRVVNADTVARTVVQLGEPTLSAITEHFGASILLPSGELNRSQLRAIIFNEPQQKTWLEQLLHPIIRQHIMIQLQSAEGLYAILESPLLLETDQWTLVNRIAVVDVAEPLQLTRAAQRDGADMAQIQAIMATQWSRLQRLARANYVIDNNGREDMLKSQVANLHQTLVHFFDQNKLSN